MEGIASNNEVANANKMIRDANNNATDNLVLGYPTYETAVGSGGAGMKSGDTFKTVQYRGRGGNSTVTARTLAVSGVANPASAEVTANTTTSASTEPTGWLSIFCATVVEGFPAITTSPETKLRKGTASTDVMLYDLAGVIVEYLPFSPSSASISMFPLSDRHPIRFS